MRFSPKAVSGFVKATIKYTSKPKAADIFTAQYLPPKEQRQVK